MRRRKPLIALGTAALVLMLGLPSLQAQHPMPQPGAGSPPPHMLAEMYAIAFEQNIATGRGFGMAFVADQNGYPGPLHVLELKERLKLTTEQESKFQALLTAMFAEAKPKSARLLDAEAKLRHLFASGQADEASVRAAAAPPLSRGALERAADGSSWRGLARCRRSDEVIRGRRRST